MPYIESKIWHFKSLHNYSRQTEMIYHPDISVLGGIGPLWDTHKLTKSAKSNEHTPKLIRERCGTSHYVPLIAECGTQRTQWEHNTFNTRATLISNTRQSHNACRTQQRHCRNSTPLIPLIIKLSSLSSNDGQRTLVEEQGEKLQWRRRGEGEKDTHFCGNFPEELKIVWSHGEIFN